MSSNPQMSMIFVKGRGLKMLSELAMPMSLVTKEQAVPMIIAETSQ